MGSNMSQVAPAKLVSCGLRKDDVVKCKICKPSVFLVAFRLFRPLGPLALALSIKFTFYYIIVNGIFASSVFFFLICIIFGVL